MIRSADMCRGLASICLRPVSMRLPDKTRGTWRALDQGCGTAYSCTQCVAGGRFAWVRGILEKGTTMKCATGTTMIANGQLLHGTGRPPVHAAALVIQDGRIAYAGPITEAPPLPAGARRIDARGGTIMPGLVEAH